MSRSDTLMYSNIKDIGDGMIEMTYGVANYTGNTLSWNNFPWGGVSKKLLPDIVMTKPDNSLYLWDKDNNSSVQTIANKETGGWMGYTQDIDNPDSFTIAFVLGKDDYNDGTIDSKRSGTSSVLAFDSGADGRDYNVFSTVDTFRVYQNDLFYLRMYIIMGKLSEVSQKAKAMVANTQRGFITVVKENAKLIPIYKTKDSETNKDILLTKGSGTPALYVYDRHVTGGRPLYLLYDNKNNKYVVSTDPYLITTKIPLYEFTDTTTKQLKKYKDILVTAPADGNTDFIGILGYVLLEDAANNDGSVKLSSVVDADLFPGNGLEDDSAMVKTSI